MIACEKNMQLPINVAVPIQGANSSTVFFLRTKKTMIELVNAGIVDKNKVRFPPEFPNGRLANGYPKNVNKEEGYRISIYLAPYNKEYESFPKHLAVMSGALQISKTAKYKEKKRTTFQFLIKFSFNCLSYKPLSKNDNRKTYPISPI